ncbi:MAG: ABC transporter permease [Actinobacteria bacterium]|nr:ABC transporter permease [Actinomycetota bacterium]
MAGSGKQRDVVATRGGEGASSVLSALGRLALAFLIAVILAFLFLPLISVFISRSPFQLLATLNTSIAYQALVLSLKTTFVSLLIIVVFGTPLAYWVAKYSFRGKRFLEVALQMPIVVPPAVAGVGLILVFGNLGLLGGVLSAFGIGIAFTSVAVVMAQVFISAAFYVFAARQAFEAVSDELLAVSRTLGETPWRTFLRITVPLALPGLISGAALALARALGEFGATIVFAGNLPGSTQTMPLAIYTALQSNFDVAVAISAILLSVAFILLLLVGMINRQQRILSS